MRSAGAALGRRALVAAAAASRSPRLAVLATATPGRFGSGNGRSASSSTPAATAAAEPALEVQEVSFVSTSSASASASASSAAAANAGGVMGDRDWSSAGGPRAPPPGYRSFRELPVNAAPATAYTVDDVAAADARRFSLHESVAFWRGYQTRFNSRSLTQADAGAGGSQQQGSSAERFNALVAQVQGLLSPSAALADAESAAYWAYHFARTSYFLGASVASVVAHHVATKLRSGGGLLPSPFGGGGEAGEAGGSPTPFENLSRNAQAELTNRLAEAVATYAQDLRNIKAGFYKLPYDMTAPTRQLNPLFVLRETASFIGAAIGTLDRRIARADTANPFDSNLGYPTYYLQQTFHYQDGGWLSSRSAEVYDISTETLFFGRQDAMQRTALLALAEHCRAANLDANQLAIVEVGCGTGRLHTFLKDNWPGAATVASDLSPFYLERAADNVRRWRAARGLPQDGGGGGGGGGVRFVQAAMEALPLDDASADVVLSVFCFHEMPVEARAAALREWARVLRPGGLVVLADSVQLGDRPEWDATLGAFGNFNEPHYRDYISCDLGALAADAAGLEPRRKYVSSATKALTFVKPTGGSSAQNEEAAATAAAELN